MSTDHEYERGIVFRRDLGRYIVRHGGRETACGLSTRLRKDLVYPIAEVDPLAIGDEVTFFATGEGTGLITAVAPRRTRFSRLAPSRLEQVIVANADLVVPVFAAASPPPHWGLLDRYLVSAEAAGLPALIVITKADLGLPQADLDLYRRIGYPVRPVSIVSGEGLQDLAGDLRGRLAVLVGKSGVGKSSLVNALLPGTGVRVGAVGKGRQGKGRHTTSHLEMFPLETGGALVDTPGMREFGLWGLGGEGLACFFPEMRPFLGGCRFGPGCRHDQEPGCALRRAVMDGAVDPRRYRSLLALQEDT